MKLESSVTIPAPKQTVWDALNDETLLIECVPGCERLERISDNELAGAVTVKLGAVKAKLNGEIRMENVNAPHSYTLVGQGKGAAGLASGRADVALHEEGPDSTRLDYSAEAKVGGKLAQMGGRLIDSTANKYASQFFATFSELVGARAGTVEPADTAPAQPEPEAEPEAAESQPPEASPRKGLHPAIWAGALILLVLAALYLFMWM